MSSNQATATAGNGEQAEDIQVIEGPWVMSPDVKAEVDTQIATAKRYPRSLHLFKQEALAMATFDEETAEGCMYALPRGGKPIEGPSIRLAEIVLSAWGNVRADAKVVGADDKEITAEAMTWDLEKNVAVRVQVKRRITDKYGNRFKDDMITVTGNAACAIALRNSVFKVIPMVYTKSIYQQARHVAIGDAQTLAAKRAQMVEYFGKMGVTPDRVFSVVGKQHIEDIGLDELALLKGLATAIKEGDTTVDQAFATPQETDSDNLKDRTKAAQEKLSEKLKGTNATTETTETEPPTSQIDKKESARLDLLTEVNELIAEVTHGDAKAITDLTGGNDISKWSAGQLKDLRAELQKKKA